MMERTENPAAFNRQVHQMFNAIAPRYDLLNRLLSGGRDRYWRRRAVARLAPKPGEYFLDIATGTADVALEIVRQSNTREVQVVGMDFSEPMLELARQKIESQDRAGIGTRIRELMDEKLGPRGITVTEFFVRELQPPETLRQAIEAKLAREQQVSAEAFQTQVVEEQANQKRAEAAGIRDAQEIIATSLTGVSGQRYLYWRYLESLSEIALGTNNLVIAPTEGGIPIFLTPSQ